MDDVNDVIEWASGDEWSGSWIEGELLLIVLFVFIDLLTEYISDGLLVRLL